MHSSELASPGVGATQRGFPNMTVAYKLIRCPRCLQLAWEQTLDGARAVDCQSCDYLAASLEVDPVVRNRQPEGLFKLRNQQAPRRLTQRFI